jgi:hypothetical protein
MPSSLHGYSTGKWMGDTLYIETTRLSPAFFAVLGGADAGRLGGPTSGKAKIIERWWPAPNGRNLMMDMVLDDPLYYEEPFLLHRREWQMTDRGDLEPWNCVPAGELLIDEDADLDAFFEK